LPRYSRVGDVAKKVTQKRNDANDDEAFVRDYLDLGCAIRNTRFATSASHMRRRCANGLIGNMAVSTSLISTSRVAK
jgi:hypothetical protein